MNRRSFMSSILALAAAPAIVRADSLMRIVARDTTVLARPGVLTLSIEQSLRSGSFDIGDIFLLRSARPGDENVYRVEAINGGVLTVSDRFSSTRGLAASDGWRIQASAVFR
jgi:hypothetical protein